MVLDLWILWQFFGGFLQEVHSQKIRVLLVIDPSEGVGDMRIVWLLLARDLGIGERAIKVAPTFGKDPGQVIGCWSESRINFKTFLIMPLGFLIFLLAVMDDPK